MCVQIRVKRCVHEPSQLKRDIATVRADGLIGDAAFPQSGLNERLPRGSGGGGGVISHHMEQLNIDPVGSRASYVPC